MIFWNVAGGPESSYAMYGGYPVQENAVRGRPRRISLRRVPEFLAGYPHSFDAEVWSQVKMPILSGLPEHYVKFEKEWEQVERTARAMVPGHHLNKLISLLRFKGCVDEAT